MKSNRCFYNNLCSIQLRKCLGSALTVVLWSMFAHILTLYSSGFILFGAISSSGINVSYLGFVLNIVQGLCFLLYPVAGILADMYWTRLRAMFYGTYIQLIGTVLLLVITVAFMINESLASRWYLSLVIVVAYALIQLGLALSEANAIQFGTDQMPEASSSQLSAFVHWYYWSLFIGQGFLILLNLIRTSNLYLFLLLASVIQILALVLAIVIMKQGIKYFEIEPAGKNPAKVIVKVIRYAIYHKTPEHRSAFTYGDKQTCRLDFAKYRYGGPFSTEEVENVKTFLRIILIFLTLIAFQFTDDTAITTKHIKALTANVTSSASLWYGFITMDTFGVSVLVILIGIPLYQLILKKLATRCALSMLKKIFLGLLCGLLDVLFLQVLEVLIALTNPYTKCPYFINNLLYNNISLDTNIISYNYLIIPQALNGLSYLFVFLTVMEFILAQAPRDMQGFLIGIWYSLQSVNLFILAIESFAKINCWGYILIIKALIMIILLVFYMVVAVRYKRRTREEVSDVNAQQIIEEYCERHIIEGEADEREHLTKYEVYEYGNYGGTYIIM